MLSEKHLGHLILDGSILRFVRSSLARFRFASSSRSSPPRLARKREAFMSFSILLFFRTFWWWSFGVRIWSWESGGFYTVEELGDWTSHTNSSAKFSTHDIKGVTAHFGIRTNWSVEEAKWARWKINERVGAFIIFFVVTEAEPDQNLQS